MTVLLLHHKLMSNTMGAAKDQNAILISVDAIVLGV